MGRFLLVEDDVATARGMRRILEGLGWTVAHASNVDDALSIFTPAPDFALIDLRLPGGIGGDTLIDRLRELCPDCMPIIWTGNAESSRFDALTARGIPVLIKPIHLPDLWAILASRPGAVIR